jgi:hypothetical protein
MQIRILHNTYYILKDINDHSYSLTALHSIIIPTLLIAMSYSDLSFNNNEEGYHLNNTSSTISIDSNNLYKIQITINIREIHYTSNALAN